MCQTAGQLVIPHTPRGPWAVYLAALVVVREEAEAREAPAGVGLARVGVLRALGVDMH